MLVAGDLEIDLARRHVSVHGETVRLTPTEYELLRYLSLHAGKPVSHTTLLRQVWGRTGDAELQALRDPNEAIFYTSGRTSNEAAFLYQLFVREDRKSTRLNSSH